MRTNLGRALGAVLAFLAAGIAVPGPVQAVDTPGEVVLPTELGTRLSTVRVLVGGPSGLAWQLTDGDPLAPVRSWRPGEDAPERVASAPVAPYGSTFGSRVGNQFAYSTAGAGSASSIWSVDVASGERVRYPSTPGQFLTGTGGGVLIGAVVSQATYFSSVVHRKPDEALPTTTWYFDGPVNLGAVADDRSAVVVARDGGTPHAFLLDLSSGAYGSKRLLGPATSSTTDTVALDDQRAYWISGSQLCSADRTDISAQATCADLPAGGATPISMAVSGGKVAVLRAAAGAYSLAVGPPQGPFRTITSTLPLRDVFPGADGGFLVHGGRYDTEGVYALPADATAVGGRAVEIRAGLPAQLDATTGRLLTTRDRQKPAPGGGMYILEDAYTRSVVRTDDGRLTVGSPTLVQAGTPGTAAPQLIGSGTLSVGRAYVSGKQFATVLDGTKEIARHAIPDDSTLALSGRRLLVSTPCPVNACDTDGAEPQDATASVIDLNGGSSTKVPYTTALFGDRVAYVLPSGEVRYRQVSTGSEQTVRPGNPIGSAAVDPRASRVLTSGDWVLWALPAAPGAFEVGAGNVATGEQIDLSADLGASVASVQLVDGVIAWVDPIDRAVRVRDLEVPDSTRTVGTARAASNGSKFLALTDEFLAWVSDTDDAAHLIPLPTRTGRPAYYLGALAPTAFTAAPSGSAGEYRPGLETSRPLKAWSLQISSGTKTVRTLTGKAPTGSVRPIWDGNDAAGRRAADGTYTWTLTGSTQSDTLTARGGKAITGSIRLDSTTPAPTLTAPPTATTGKGIALRWSSAEKGVKWTVKVALGTPSGTTVKYSSAKTWLTATSAVSATYRTSKVPYALKANRYYRFTVTATDPLGNVRTSSSKTVRVPS